MKMCSTIYDLGEYKIGLFHIFRSQEKNSVLPPVGLPPWAGRGQ